MQCEDLLQLAKTDDKAKNILIFAYLTHHIDNNTDDLLEIYDLYGKPEFDNLNHVYSKLLHIHNIYYNKKLELTNLIIDHYNENNVSVKELELQYIDDDYKILVANKRLIHTHDDLPAKFIKHFNDTLLLKNKDCLEFLLINGFDLTLNANIKNNKSLSYNDFIKLENISYNQLDQALLQIGCFNDKEVEILSKIGNTHIDWCSTHIVKTFQSLSSDTNHFRYLKYKGDVVIFYYIKNLEQIDRKIDYKIVSNSLFNQLKNDLIDIVNGNVAKSFNFDLNDECDFAKLSDIF